MVPNCIPLSGALFGLVVINLPMTLQLPLKNSSREVHCGIARKRFDEYVKVEKMAANRDYSLMEKIIRSLF
jgi:hypothetical protein